MESPMITRRDFLKLAAGLPFLSLAQLITLIELEEQPAVKQAQSAAQPWAFPLSLPAYFTKETRADRREKIHKVHIPMVGK